MKDYKKLEEKINGEKEITIDSIKELGYSRYDINLFIEAGILSRSKRGLYLYLPEISNVKDVSMQSVTEEETVLKEETRGQEDVSDIGEQLYQYVNQGIYNLIKRQNEEAIVLFNEALKLEPTHSRALFGLVGAYVFLNDYYKAYEYLIEFYNIRRDNSLLYNVYYYLLVLREHISIDDNLLEDIKIEIENGKDTIKKLNPNFKRLHKSLDEGNYLDALKFANFSISIDKKDRKYHLTNHIYKALIMATLRLKGIDPYVGIISYKEGREQSPSNVVVEQLIQSEEKSEEVIVVPEVKEEEIIKTNLLLEAISNNDYELAISLVDREQIDNPLDVIKTLLSKLAIIKSLVTSNIPIKVVDVEHVHAVNEQCVTEALDASNDVVEVEKVAEIPDVVNEVKVEEIVPTSEELVDIAYKAYKEAYHSEQFEEALKNLRRYEFLNNSNGKQRNINYHCIRIENSKKDFEKDSERYIKKKALSRVIFDLKREKRYDAALAAIEEFKSLGGVKNELVIITEAEIYFALGDYSKVSVILNGIRTTEEPSYFMLSSKLAFKNYKFQEALLFCQSYNERRPNQSPSNYQLMGDCYTKLGKPGKAIKAYRKAEEVAAQYGGKSLDLSSKISRQEMFSEYKKEERTTRSLSKKK